MNSYRLQGALKSDAHTRIYADGTAVVLVLIDQPGGDPLLAERAFGNGPAAGFAANNAARAMRRGAQVTVHGKRLKSGHFQGGAVLVLDGVDHIEHTPAQTHAEPITAEAH